jgi:hypothetical protein
MLRRIFDIITFPFYLVYLFVSFPFYLAKIIIEAKIEDQKRSGRNRKKLKNDDLVEAGKYLFPDYFSDFEIFIKSFLQNKAKFILENKALLLGYDNFEMNKLKPIDVIYIFGDSKKLFNLADWRGEENESETEHFLEETFDIKSEWKNANRLRKGSDEDDQDEGGFIIDLFKAIDKDLKPLHKRLVFLDLGWDSYVYTIVEKSSHKILTERFGILVHGTENLMK